MSNPTAFLRFPLRTNLVIFLIVLDVASVVMLQRASRPWSESPAPGASERIDQQIKQALNQNAEDLKFIENNGHWTSGVLFALETLRGGGRPSTRGLSASRANVPPALHTGCVAVRSRSS